MNILRHEIPLDCSIFDAGDLHSGPHGFDEHAFDDLIAEIKSRPEARLILKGDLVDCITPDDNRFSVHSIDIKQGFRNIDDHAAFLIDKLRPIKDKILHIHWGNHEYKVAVTTDITKRMCKELGVKFAAWIAVSTFINKTRSKHLFKALTTHGRRQFTSNAKDAIQSEANIKAALKNYLTKFRFTDCVIMSLGHAHKLIIAEPTVNHEVMLTSTNTGLKQSYRVPVAQNADYIDPDSRYFVCSGTFLKTFAPQDLTNYSETFGYGPVEIGCAEWVIKGGKIVDVKKRLF